MAKTFLSDPDSVEREYIRLLTWYSTQYRIISNRLINERYASIQASFNELMKSDSYADDIILMLALIADAIVGKTRIVEAKLPGIFALLAKHNDRQFRMVVKANTGVELPESRGLTGSFRNTLAIDLYRNEPWLAEMQKTWVSQNVALVKSIGDEYHTKLESIVRQGVLNGVSGRDLAKELQKTFDISKSRAQFIATDQILKANAELTQYRLESVGVEGYKWRTVKDSRVRPEHADREGKIFSYDKPPSGGHPGYAYRCRCHQEPIFPEE